jgi:peroxiredoxin family protein
MGACNMGVEKHPVRKPATRDSENLIQQRAIIESSVHMLRCKLNAAMYGVVTNDNRMIVDALNEMETFVADLERKTR